jgi:hypothetical protein
VDEPSDVEDADAQLIALAGGLSQRPNVLGEVLDGPPTTPPGGVPGRQPGAGAPGGAGLAIPGLQLTA